ncbi:MAG: hypothetical protein ACO22T_03010 [Burkholderiales bacterium]
MRDRVVRALENRGLAVNYTAKVGEMIDRNGRDPGRDRRIYNQAEVIKFCSAALSRDTMEADLRNIVFVRIRSRSIPCRSRRERFTCRIVYRRLRDRGNPSVHCERSKNCWRILPPRH